MTNRTASKKSPNCEVAMYQTRDELQDVKTQVVTNPDRIEWASQFARRVQIELARGNWEAAKEVIDSARADAETPDKPNSDKLRWSMFDLGISMRTSNLLETQGIITVSDLLGWTADSLGDVPELGKVLIANILKAVRDLKLTGEDYARWRMTYKVNGRVAHEALRTDGRAGG